MKPEQLQLLASPPKLTDRQQQVLDHLAQHDQLDSSDIGAWLHRTHQRRCACAQGGECDWARSNGQAILEALRKKGLAKRDRHWNYRATARPSEVTPAQTFPNSN